MYEKRREIPNKVVLNHFKILFQCIVGEYKVKLHLSIIENHTMKTFVRKRYSSTHSTTSTLKDSLRSASQPGRFIPGKRA
jgi:hypothetical protein